MLNEKKLIELNNLLKFQLQKIKNEPKIVYHYTSQNAFKNIIENKKIWFSNVAYLNDYAEPYYIFELLKKEYLNKNILNLNTSFFDTVQNNLNKYCEYNKENNVEYIASFSTDKDNLSLWNYYSKGSEIGFNIGFNLKNFDDLKPADPEKKYSYMSIGGNVIYDKKIQKEFIKNILLEYNKIYEDNVYKKPNIEQITKIFLKYLFSIFCYYNLFFKDKAFKIEKEWRLVIVYSTEQNLFRIDKGFFIPYYEFLFDEKAIQSINFLAPNNTDIAKKRIDYFLKKNDLNITANHSNITIRY